MLYIDGKPLSHIDNIQFVMVKVERNIWTGKNKYLIDVGQSAEIKSVLTNESGKEINFQSEIDVMNYMHQQGWAYRQTAASSNPSTGATVYQIIFSKRDD